MTTPEKQGNYITDTNKNGLLVDELLASYSDDGYLTQQELNYLKSQYNKEKNLIREDIRVELGNLINKTQQELDKIQAIPGGTKKVYVDSMSLKAQLKYTRAGDMLPKVEQTKTGNHKKRETVDEQRRKEIKTWSDVHSPGDFARYIENFLDDSMKKNEEIIGIDNIYKITFLTYLHTSVELGKGVIGVLKIGEGTAQTALDISDMSSADQKDLVKIFSCLGGVGIDVLNAASIIPGVGVLVKQTGLSAARIGQLLKRIPTPPKLTQMGGFATNEVGAVGHGVEDLVKAKPKKSIIKKAGDKIQEARVNMNPEKYMDGKQMSESTSRRLQLLAEEKLKQGFNIGIKLESGKWVDLNREKITNLEFNFNNGEIKFNIGKDKILAKIKQGNGQNYEIQELLFNGKKVTSGQRIYDDGEVFYNTITKLYKKELMHSKISSKAIMHEGIQFTKVDLASLEFNKAFSKAENFKKFVEIKAIQATKETPIETVVNGVKETKNVAQVGDWIATNPGGEKYVIKSDKFVKLYEPKSGVEGVFQPKGEPIKAIQIDRDVAFKAPWGEDMYIKKGGWIIEGADGGRYGIEAKAFKDTYKKTEVSIPKTVTVKPKTKAVPEEIIAKNAKFNPEERIAEAEKLLGKLSQPQKNAILEAHNYGVGKNGKYTPAELKVKAEILKKAGFNPEQRDILMRNNITGVFGEIISGIKSEAKGLLFGKQEPLTPLQKEIQSIENRIKELKTGKAASHIENPIKPGETFEQAELRRRTIEIKNLEEELMMKRGELTLSKQKPLGVTKESSVGSRTVENYNPNLPRRNPNRLPYNEIPRPTDVISLPDLHGDFKAFILSLEKHGLIDGAGNWIGGNKKIVQLGDIFDRGDEGLKILEKINQLKAQGANIDLLAGNHEDMMLRAMFGDFEGQITWGKLNKPGKEFENIFPKDFGLGNGSSYISPEDSKIMSNTLIKYLKGHIEDFSNMKLLSQVDDVLYLHSEPSLKLVELIKKYGIDGINKKYQEALKKALNGNPSDFINLTSNKGEFFEIMWSRNLSRNHLSSKEIGLIGKNLKEEGINLIIHGHTEAKKGVIEGSNLLGNVRSVNLDTGISNGMSHGSQAGGLTIKTGGEWQM